MVRPDLPDVFARFVAGDPAAVAEFQPLFDRVAPDLVWDSTELGAPDVAAVLHGPEGVIEFFRRWLAAWSSFTWRTHDYEVRGDDVIYDVDISARSAQTGLPVDMRVTHRMTIRDGKLVAWRLFRDRNDA